MILQYPGGLVRGRKEENMKRKKITVWKRAGRMLFERFAVG
jgi:hypothetical protein